MKLTGTRSRSRPIGWIRYWSDPSTSLSKDLTCFMLWDDGCMILWQDSFGVHLAFCHVALFQRCSHYEMPVSFLSVTVYVSEIAILCPIQCCIHNFMPIFKVRFYDSFLILGVILLPGCCRNSVSFCVVAAMSSSGERELYNIRNFDGTNFSMWKE